MARVPLRRAARYPIFDQSYLFGRKAALPFEVALSWRGLPGRHDALLCCLRNLRGVRPDVAVIEEAKRRGFSRPMAGSAGAIEDRSDIFRVRLRGQSLGERT